MEESQMLELANKKIIDFAESQNPKVWHQMTMDWNWDSEYNFLDWLINNSKTDRATILMIYWKSSPSHGFKNKILLEERYTNNFYNNQNIYFNPKDDEGDDWTEYNKDGAFEIPKIMFTQLEGEYIEYPNGYIEGIPEKLFYEIEELYE